MVNDSETKVTTVSNEAPQRVQITKEVVQKQPVDPQSPQQSYQKKKVIFRTYQFVWYILGIVEVLLVFRLLLKMLGANVASSFVSLIYGMSDLFALPFAGILGVTSTNTSVFEWSTLVAMAVYLVVAYGIIQLLQLIKPTNPQEVEQTVDNP